MESFHSVAHVAEPARDVALFGEFDVVVLGGGPAGIAAAAAAARNGARVLLAERYGFLGGMGTAAGVTNFCGLHANVFGNIRQVVHGVADDLLERMRSLDGLNEPHLVLGKTHAQAYDMSAVAGDVQWVWPPIPESRGYNQLPYRMLLPRRSSANGVENLLVAGRCASMTHDGQSAARVTGACFVMGQAAGTAAALAFSKACTPYDIDIRELQRLLVQQGAFLGARERL